MYVVFWKPSRKWQALPDPHATREIAQAKADEVFPVGTKVLIAYVDEKVATTYVAKKEPR